MKGYGQACPIAKGAEVLAERWTPLVVRNLYLGAETFSEILEGVPRMSRTLLAERLRTLERSGILHRRPAESGKGGRYALTDAGRELADVCLALGAWSARWLDITGGDSDPFGVLWTWKHYVQRDRLPQRRVVVRFVLTDRPRDQFWLLLGADEVELRVKPHPTLADDLVVTTDSDTLTRVHMGRLDLDEAQRGERWRTEGSPELVRAFPSWGGLNPFADVVPAHAT